MGITARIITTFALAAIGMTTASAGVVRVTAGGFTPAAGLITFSEFPLGTFNPPYAPAIYGGGAGMPNVSFGGFFTGQSQGAASPPCPIGAILTGCVLGTPSGPLSIAVGSPTTRIVDDVANSTTPVLSGTPTFNGSIAVLFDVDLVGVGLEGGFFNAIGGTAITAYDRGGATLGSVTNTGLGIEFLGLVTDTGTAAIAGLLFSLVGAEPAGFAIDNLRFALAGGVVLPPGVGVPEPGTALLLAIGLVAGFAARRRLRQ